MLLTNPEDVCGAAIFDRPAHYVLPNDSFGVVSVFGGFKDDFWHKWRNGTGLKMRYVAYVDYIDVSR